MLLAFLVFGSATFAFAADNDATLRVMSFNVRLGTAKDGDYHWDKRKEFLVETIQKFRPDLLGTQETLSFQKDYLASQLPEYGVEGVGRNDGKNSGESMAVYYRKDRFEMMDVGHFWLSETPDVIGSKSWDSSLPRMVTWLKLRDKKAAGHPVIYFANTHFDHLGKQARAESARLVRERVAAWGPGIPVIVTGDFNAGEGSEPYQNLFAARDGKQSQLLDTYRLKHPMRDEAEATFNGFKPETRIGSRIDWIAITSQFEVLDAVINRVTRDKLLPSDHYPIEVVLKYLK